MAITIAVKNTFLDYKAKSQEAVRRSSSVPRSFKPEDFVCYSQASSSALDGQWTKAKITGTRLIWNNIVEFVDGESLPIIVSDNGRGITIEFKGETLTATLEDDDKLHWSDGDVWSRSEVCDDYGFKPSISSHHGDDSTNASDKGVRDNSPTTSSDNEKEQRWADYHSDCSDDGYDVAYPREGITIMRSSPVPVQDATPKSKVTLSLCALTEGTEKVRTKLRSQARAFKSARAPPAELMAMISNAVEVLSTGRDIFDVQVQDGGMGGTTMIVAKSAGLNQDMQCAFSMVKDAVLKSAEESKSTYVLGYGANPFNNLDSSSFSFQVASVPAAHQSSACWSTYEKGFCQWRATCRCDHPSEADMMRVIVMVKSGW